MAKSIKLKNNNFIDSTGIVHNRELLSGILNSNNTDITGLKEDTTDLKSKTSQFKNKEYSGVTTSSTSFTVAGGVYLAMLWVNAGSLLLPALYVVCMNANGGGAVCCGESGNAKLSVSGTTVTVSAPYGNVVFYSLTRVYY